MLKPLAISLLVLTTGCLSDELPEDVELGDLVQYNSVHQWTEDIKIPAQSPYQPALAQVDSAALLAAFTRTGTKEVHIWRMGAPRTWGLRAALPYRADYGPAMKMHGGAATLVYKGAGENRFLMTRSTDSGWHWSSPVTVGAGINGYTIVSPPSIESKDGNLFLAYCLRRNNIDYVRIDRLQNGTWSSVRHLELPGGRCRNVHLTTLAPGNLHLVFNEESISTGIWYMKQQLSSTGTTWTSSQTLSMKSKKPVSILTCNGITHFVHGGYSSPSEIWWTYRNAGGGWEPDVKVPGQVSDGGAGLGCFNGRAIMLHNGGYDDLWWSEFGP